MDAPNPPAAGAVAPKEPLPKEGADVAGVEANPKPVAAGLAPKPPAAAPPKPPAPAPPAAAPPKAPPVLPPTRELDWIRLIM